MRRAVVLVLLAGCGGGDGGGGAADAGFQPRTLSFTTGDWSIDPATEPTRCVFSRLPGDVDVMVGAYRATMLPGSHHFNMFYADPNDPIVAEKPLDTLTSCDYGYATYLAGSQWTEVDEVIPEGFAIRVPRGSIMVLESHYVNATDFPVTGRVDVELDARDPATVTTEIGLYFNLMEDIRIDPGEHVRLSASCPTDADVNLVLMTSHSHHFNELFEINLIDEATGDSTPIYASQDYAHPTIEKLYDAPIAVPAGRSLEWACNYRNTTPNVVTGGGSAETDEMCIMAAFYYPKKSGQPYCFAQPERTPLP